MAQDMKNTIALKDFIYQIKRELIEAIEESKRPLFILKDIDLEFCVGVHVQGDGKVKFLVGDLSGNYKHSQINKVKMTLTPFVETGKPVSKKHTKPEQVFNLWEQPTLDPTGKVVGLPIELNKEIEIGGKHLRPTLLWEEVAKGKG